MPADLPYFSTCLTCLGCTTDLLCLPLLPRCRFRSLPMAGPQVKSLLASKVQDIDSIIDAVPDLMNPQQLTQSLSNLVAWFPNHDPFELLQQNPQILENPNVEADPTYGKCHDSCRGAGA